MQKGIDPSVTTSRSVNQVPSDRCTPPKHDGAERHHDQDDGAEEHR